MITCFDPSGTHIASGDSLGWVCVSLSMPQYLIWQHRQTAAITALAWSWDGAYLASGDAVGAIHVWNVQAGELMQSAQGHHGAVTDLLWSPTTYTLTSSAKQDALLRLWDYSLLLQPCQPRQTRQTFQKMRCQWH